MVGIRTRAAPFRAHPLLKPRRRSDRGPRRTRRRILFDNFRQSLEDLVNRSTPPDERRQLASQMRDTLVQAKVGVADLKDALAKVKQQLAIEEREVETMRRRKRLATDVHDVETAALAERHEGMHTERATVLARKVAAQEEELALVEREVAEMTVELKKAMLSGASAGAPPRSVAPGDDVETDGSSLASELDALGRARVRTEREAEADRRLDELKRRMGQ